MSAQKRLAIATAGFRGGGGGGAMTADVSVAVAEPEAVAVDDQLAAAEAEGTVAAEPAPFTVLHQEEIGVRVDAGENTEI